MNPLFAIDFYKADHRRQYPSGATKVYSNFTARSNKLSNIPAAPDKVVFFGLRYFILKHLIDDYNKYFFSRQVNEVVGEYKQLMDDSLGTNAISTDHITALHNLGYLPLKIKALPEGTRVPIGTPMLTITNTHPNFFWLVNYIESVMSAYLWKPCVSATTACAYRELMESWCDKTSGDVNVIPFQCHDFSFRGMSGLEDASLSGAGHLLSFLGTDSVPSIKLLQQYYAAGNGVGYSVPATEHSVMCMGGMDDEIGTFERLITDIYPSGIVSIVSDTWDFWKVISEYLPLLKDKIMTRDGKVVIRPDSGDPVKIICGDPEASDEWVRMGAVEALWRIFGGTEVNGFKRLDSHIGIIYGDSITIDRADNICRGLAEKGFASTNVVFGVGSFTYQYVTRDTYSFAVKATYGEVDGIGRNIQKSPKTDSGGKNSLCGLLRVNEDLSVSDKQNIWQEDSGMLRVVFNDGIVSNSDDLSTIRNRLYQS